MAKLFRAIFQYMIEEIGVYGILDSLAAYLHDLSMDTNESSIGRKEYTRISKGLIKLKGE